MPYYTNPSDVADIQLTNEYPGNAVPKTVIESFRMTVSAHPHRQAMAVKRDGTWKSWKYEQYYNEVCQAARAMIKLGLERFHGVGILGFNSPEWFISDLAAIFAGGFAVGIYTTNSPDACKYVAFDSKSQIIIVEDDKQLQKILQVKDQLPELKAIVQYLGTPSAPNVYSWEQFMALGEGSELEETLRERTDSQKPGNCCTLIYTSGTTGDPKGVMLSHDNMTWTAARAADCLEIGEEHLISYLPLSHVAAQMLDIHLPLSVGATVWFAQPDALKGSLIDTMKEVRPTIFLGVPRVWEKIYEKMREVGRSTTGIMKYVADTAKAIGYQGNLNLEKKQPVPWGWWLANTVVFSAIRRALGLDRSKIQITGAAPVSREIIDYFMSINLPLYDIYGMSESTALETACYPGHWKSGTCGTAVPGINLRIHDPIKTSSTTGDGDGEVQFFGRHVMMGYLGKPEKTAEAFTEDGWLRSGDVGHLDHDGYLMLTGRIKELIITAGGENVPPVLIEDEVKQELPFLSNCMLIGDRRKYLTILVTLKCDPDAEGNPTDNLSKNALTSLSEIGSSATTVTEAMNDPLVKKAVEEGIVRRNKKAFSNAQKIQKFEILPVDFSIPGGELGPTLKLKRQTVLEKYSDVIETMYSAPHDA